ncbi:excinuclease ABC subunit A (plasmid) [Ralstonia pseudosolanacearum]|uniref:Excinuclease ABC subunit A n=1 Tax=Ralstonia solanacearum TaxID=305 RepID=A0AA92K592_RALSL|nr:excinuclease ABC subunit A [Ralstonia pseudosolanacearum]QOK98817.1 excinuclease ABC subunit A [Ralstonia pseudosolanacearum]
MKPRLLLISLCFAAIGTPALARDDVDTYPISEALASEGPDKIAGDIGLYFAGQQHAPVAQSLGVVSLRKTTSTIGAPMESACQYALISTVQALQARARQMGGNAVVEIKSNDRKYPVENTSEFACRAGTFVVAVALKGEVVKLDK